MLVLKRAGLQRDQPWTGLASRGNRPRRRLARGSSNGNPPSHASSTSSYHASLASPSPVHALVTELGGQRADSRRSGWVHPRPRERTEETGLQREIERLGEIAPRDGGIPYDVASDVIPIAVPEDQRCGGPVVPNAAGAAGIVSQAVDRRLGRVRARGRVVD